MSQKEVLLIKKDIQNMVIYHHNDRYNKKNQSCKGEDKNKILENK